MSRVEETIPAALQPAVDASLAWFNAQESERFEVTGIVDAADAGEVSGEQRLRLILCGGDRCEQRSFRAVPEGDAFAISFLDEPAPGADAPEPRLDPPPGARRGWLDGVLGRHAFTVLVFYRGFW